MILINKAKIIEKRYNYMDLKEKLEILNENSTIADIQKYIKDMKKVRKFDGVTEEN